MQEQLQAFNTNEYLQAKDPKNERSMLQTNIINADRKLQKYRALLTSPVYYAAVVLVPQQKWDYFEDHLTRGELRTARKAVQKLWDNDYTSLDLGALDITPSKVSTQVSQYLHKLLIKH